MRVVGEITHPECKVTLFSFNQKYLIKVEQGPCEQTYKVSELDVEDEQDLRSRLTGPFLEKVLTRFRSMHEDLMLFSFPILLCLLTSCVTNPIKIPYQPQFQGQAPGALAPKFELFKPDETSFKGPRPLVVVLHGCLQTAEAMFGLTKLNDEAARSGFFVLYPNQIAGRHPLNCWNWFDPTNQKSNSGELAELMTMIQDVSRANPIDAKKVYIAGISSGAATASFLLACYPKIFAGGALIASPAFGIAKSETEAQLAISEPANRKRIHRETCQPTNFKGRVLIEVGTEDRTVHPTHAALLSEQFAQPYERNLVSSPTWKLASPGSMLYITTCFGRDSRVCRITVDGLGHAWSGGTLNAFSEPNGPSTAEMIRRYLIENSILSK